MIINNSPLKVETMAMKAVLVRVNPGASVDVVEADVSVERAVEVEGRNEVVVFIEVVLVVVEVDVLAVDEAENGVVRRDILPFVSS